MAIATLDAGFAAFGRQCASQKYIVFVLFLILSTFLSWPTILELNRQAKSTNTPTAFTHDHFWQHSPHVQPVKLNAPLNNATHTAYQIQFVQQPDKARAAGSAGSERLPVDQMLLARARAWQHALVTRPIELDDGESRKNPITLKHLPTFTLISPFDHYWLPDDPIPINWPSSINPDRLDPLTVFDNVALDDQGRLVSADAIIMTVVIPRDVESIWSKAVEQQNQNHQLSWHVRQMRAPVHSSHKPWLYRYRTKDALAMVSLPPVSTKACLFIGLHLLVFYVVSATFSRLPLINSPYVLGMAAVAISMICLATTITVLDHFDVNIDAIPWLLLPLVSLVASTENQLLLANAVVHAGCDMSVREKVGRGLQSVGVPMLGTLVAELIILEIGRAIQSRVIQQFCQFGQVALIVEHILEMTLFTGVLSIDMNRAQLADLADRHVSKRLREFARSTHQHPEVSFTNETNFCPVQDMSAKEQSHVGRRGRTCAECKHFKTHRAVSALMLCLVILSTFLIQSFRSSPSSQTTVTFGLCNVTDDAPSRPPPSPTLVAERLEKASAQYWEFINPAHETQWIHVEPPILFVSYVEPLILSNPLRVPGSSVFEEQYRTKVYHQHRSRHNGKPSRIRIFALACVQQVLALLWNINFPLCILLVIFVGMVIWLYSSCRNQSLLVLSINMLGADKTSPLHRLLAAQSCSSTTATPSPDPSRVEKNQQSAHGPANELSVKTLSGQHVADIHRFDINQKHQLAVSCGHDDRMVVWNTRTCSLVRRIDSTCLVKRVRIDRNAKWIANVTYDGVVRVWHAHHDQTAPTRTFMTEIEQEGRTPALLPTRRRKQKQQGGPIIDRIQDVQFIGITQDHLVTIHKSGAVREWDILTGECIHTISYEHGHGSTTLHVVELNNTLAPQTMASWMFLACKDGQISCWKRQNPAGWEHAYSIPEAHAAGHAITALGVETPPLAGGGMGLVVSGASDGSIKAWDFETGNPVCTLRDSNPAAGVSKLVVTRYCESIIDNDRTASCCGNSDTCPGSGYLVGAYSLMKNRVSGWRLEYAGTGSSAIAAIEGRMQCCSKDNDRLRQKRLGRKGSNSDPAVIEQLGGKGQPGLVTFYLGSVVQYGGRGIAFCSTGYNRRLMLTGIRMNRSLGQWEVWSAPTLLDHQEPGKSMMIPVDTLKIGTGDEANDNEASELLPFSAVRHVLPLADSHGNPGGFACDFGNFIKVVDPSAVKP